MMVATGWVWMITLFSCGVIAASSEGGLYQLKVPQMYAALAGDLHIGFVIPANVSLPHAFVRILSISDVTPQEITSIALPLGTKKGDLLVTCGIVDFAGRFVARLFMHDGGNVLTETEFDVIWPPIHLALPERYVALTSSVKLRITSSVVCKSLLNLEKFNVEVYHIRRMDIDRLPLESSHLIANTSVIDFTNEVVIHKFPCNFFDIDGSYQAVLRSSNYGDIMTRSNVMVAVWSSNYNLGIRSKTIFPCPNLFNIIYTRPACPSKDKIRVFMLKRDVKGSLAAPLKRKYVLERRLNSDMTMLRLSCGLFNKTSAGYCFMYVSVAKSGAVQEQKEVCISSHPDSVLPIDGGWSGWSEWSSCSPVCGAGQRSRHRLCDTPTPSEGGKFCEGHAFEWQTCFNMCPDEVPKTPLKLLSLTSKCACGCVISAESGGITASGRCQGKAVWLIKSSPAHRVRFKFKYFNLLEDSQVVTIRNGESEKADILFRSSDSDFIREVYSTGSYLYIELHTKHYDDVKENRTLPIYVHGFLALFESEALSPTPASIIRRDMESILDSPATTAGIALCSVIVLLAIVFVAFHKIFQKRRHKYAMAGTDSPARSVSGGSCHESNIVAIETDDIQVPLTDETKRKHLPSANGISRKSSVSSVCSTGFKRLCSASEGDPKNKPSNKGYTPLVSPSGNQETPEMNSNEKRYFQGSPILRKCAPRSPKVHPSPKLRHMNNQLNSPSSTKHDILTKKRTEATGVENSYMNKKVSIDCSKNKMAPEKIPVVTIPPQPFNSCEYVKPRTESDVTAGGMSMATIQTSNTNNKMSKKETTTSFIQTAPKAKRPESLTESPPYDEGAYNHQKSVSNERDRVLPKPDGQSPKQSHEEECTPLVSPAVSCKPSKTSSKQSIVSSPTHSIHTPSEIALEGLELEYDDFIDDDPLSYFDYDEMQRLKWHGGEKIGKPLKEEDD